MTTRWSVVLGIKNPEDNERWTEFYDIYGDRIFAIALKAGLREDEARDAVQETMRSVAKKIQNFEPTPARGSFRAWLLRAARWRINDQRKKRLSVCIAVEVRDAAATPTIERIPEISGVDLEQLCDAEWRKAILNKAFQELRLKVKGHQYQLFHMLEIEGLSVLEVSNKFKISAARIYVERNRARLKLRKILSKYESML